MNDHEVVDSNFSAIINAPLDKVDIPKWCFSLGEADYFDYDNPQRRSQ